jgi:hypothetical protein
VIANDRNAAMSGRWGGPELTSQIVDNADCLRSYRIPDAAQAGDHDEAARYPLALTAISLVPLGAMEHNGNILLLL